MYSLFLTIEIENNSILALTFLYLQMDFFLITHEKPLFTGQYFYLCMFCLYQEMKN